MCIPRNISLPFPTPVRIIQLAMKAVPLQLLFCLVYTGSLFSSIDNDKACLSLCVTSVLPSVYTVDCSLQDSPQVSVSLGRSITGYNWVTVSSRLASVPLGLCMPTLWTAGVLQDSVLGFMLFTIFTSPVNHNNSTPMTLCGSILLCHAEWRSERSGKLKLEQCLSSMYTCGSI